MTALRLTVEEVALVLAGERRLTSGTLATEAGISRRAAQRVVAELAAAGTVTRDTTPQPTGYRRGKRERRYYRS